MDGDPDRRDQRVAAGDLGPASLVLPGRRDAVDPPAVSAGAGVAIGRSNWKVRSTMPDDAAQGRADFPAGPASRTRRHGRPTTEDPVVRSGRREALWTLALWLAATIYSVTYCTLHGYGRPVESLSFVLWFPDWVFWGIVVPWLVCTAVSIYFALVRDRGRSAGQLGRFALRRCASRRSRRWAGRRSGDATLLAASSPPCLACWPRPSPPAAAAADGRLRSAGGAVGGDRAFRSGWATRAQQVVAAARF